jgi:hypothetical protein
VTFDLRAALCTALVLAGFAFLARGQLAVGLVGWAPMAREGRAPLSHGGAASPDEERDILSAVLLHEARRPNRSNLCLRLAPEGQTFEQEKRVIRALQQQLVAEPERAQSLRDELERRLNPERRWFLPAEPGAEEAPITPESARPLRTAEVSLLGSPAGRAIDLILNLAELPVGLQASGGDCNPLFFTAPAVAGEIAFVETTYRCGPGCEEGRIYAAVRRDERWQVGALTPSWTN